MEGETNHTVFVLDVYNKYKNKDKVRRIFQLNSHWYAIYEVYLNFGKPELGYFDDEYFTFKIFNTLEEANKCVDKMIIAARTPF